MKKSVFPMLATICSAFIVIAGCDTSRVEPDSVSGSEVLFTFDEDVDVTKSTSTASESTVSEWCLYVVNSAGVVFDAVSVTSETVTRKLPDGSYTAYAAVNCGLSAGSFSNESQIKAYECSLSSETSMFSMFGGKAFTVSGGATCSIPVYRLVSRVAVNKVSVDFSRYPDLAAKTFTLDRIYLINVSAKSRLENTTTYMPGTWYNKRGYVSGEASSILYDNVGVTVTPSSPHNTAHYFYCYQNNSVSDTHVPTWSARHTRLVLECTLGETKTYYPIDIIGNDSRLARNSLYTINEIHITNYGSKGPDELIEASSSFYFDVAVSSWDGTHTVNESF